MFRDKVNLLRGLFRYRMVAGEVIPPDARVDPEHFPEKDFPLYCPVCEYLLRGLPSERCPECGTPFDRGSLLVQQYVIEHGKRRWKRTGKYATRLFIIGCLLIFVPQILITLTTYLIKPSVLTQPTTNLAFALIPFVMAVMTMGAILLFVAAFLYLHLATIGRKKYTQVLASIDRDNPSFQTAQQRKWIWWVVWIGMMIALLIIAATRSGRVWYRYYAQAPARALIPIVGAIGIGIWIRIGTWLSKRWQKKHDDLDKT